MASVQAGKFPLKLDGVEYLMTPLDDKDIDELDNWLRSTTIQVAMEACKDFPESERRLVVSEAIKQARGMSFMSADGQKAMASVAGISRLAWQSLKKTHPELTPEIIQKKLMTEQSRTDFILLWQELNVGETRPGSPKAKAGNSKVRSRRSKRTRR
jgi:hypothetical protein